MHTTVSAIHPHGYLTPRGVCEKYPFLSVNHLAQMRFTGAAERGEGPKYLRPSPRTILYRESDIINWIESSERTGTAEVA